jgi:hypothetical protein
MSRLRYLLPLALVTGLLAVPVALSAAQPAIVVKLSSNATLIDSTSVAVGVTYSCQPFSGSASTGAGEVELEQSGINFGSGTFTAFCNDHNQQTTVIVTGGPFTAGKAEAFGIVDNGVSDGSSGVVGITIH